MLEKIKTLMDITDSAYDDQVEMLIEAAVDDLKLSGVDSAEADSTDASIIDAVCRFCKAYFGEEPSEAWVKLYDLKKAQLMVSSAHTTYTED